MHSHHPLSWSKIDRNLHIARENQDALSKICDAANGDADMWLDVNESVLNLTWILSRYKRYKRNDERNDIANCSSLIGCSLSTTVHLACTNKSNKCQSPQNRKENFLLFPLYHTHHLVPCFPCPNLVFFSLPQISVVLFCSTCKLGMSEQASHGLTAD